MKKSTLLYIGLQAIILLTPLFFLTALRVKIATGDVIDIAARRASFYNNIPLADIHEIEVVCSDYRDNLEVSIEVLSTMNMMKVDTVALQSMTYSVSEGKLRIDYHPKKDTLNRSNTEYPAEEYNDYTGDDRSYRSITLYVKSTIDKMNLTQAIATLSLDENEQLKNNLSVTCRRSDFRLHGPYLVEEQKDENGEDIVRPYHYQHNLNLRLLDGSAVIFTNIDSIKKFDLELKDQSTINEFIPAEEFNLSIDPETAYAIDIHDVDKVNVTYEK